MKTSKPNRIGEPLDGPDLQCPSCSKILEGIMSAEEQPELTPRPGDVSVCAYCGTLLEFSETLGLILPSDETLIRAAGAPGMKAAFDAFDFIKREGR